MTEFPLTCQDQPTAIVPSIARAAKRTAIGAKWRLLNPVTKAPTKGSMIVISAKLSIISTPYNPAM